MNASNAKQVYGVMALHVRPGVTLVLFLTFGVSSHGNARLADTPGMAKGVT